MNWTFLAYKQTGSHLDADRAEGIGSGKLPSVRNPAGSDNRDIYPVHHLRDKCQRCHLPNMSAALRPFGDDHIGACPDKLLCQKDACTDRNYQNTGLLPHLHIFLGTAGPCRHHLDAASGNKLSHPGGVRVHEHEVDAERLVRQRLADPDMFLKFLRIHTAGADDSKCARIGHGCCEGTSRDICHSALYKWVFDSEYFIQILHADLLISVMRSAPAGGCLA